MRLMHMEKWAASAAGWGGYRAMIGRRVQQGRPIASEVLLLRL